MAEKTYFLIYLFIHPVHCKSQNDAFQERNRAKPSHNVLDLLHSAFHTSSYCEINNMPYVTFPIISVVHATAFMTLQLYKSYRLIDRSINQHFYY